MKKPKGKFKNGKAWSVWNLKPKKKLKNGKPKGNFVFKKDSGQEKKYYLHLWLSENWYFIIMTFSFDKR